MKASFTIQKSNKLLDFIFFGNYFYGLCAVILSIEATLQQRFPLNNIVYFFFVFLATVLYYTYPYVRRCSFISANSRTNWYTRNYNFVRLSQISSTVILAAVFAFFLFNYSLALLHVPLLQWLIIFIFPIVAALYYGLNKYNIRQIGWLKPFIIGFTWAGLVTVYPVLFYCIVNKQPYEITTVGTLLFLKNFVFITALCIMFDVKDYASDYLKNLKTFVVNIGLRNTIFFILFPLAILGLFSFIIYAELHEFPLPRVLLNIIPFLLLIAAAFSLRKRRSILYYLIVIDGLMLVKGLCGTVAMLCF